MKGNRGNDEEVGEERALEGGDCGGVEQGDNREDDAGDRRAFS
jgi:hypothetical protein